LELLPPPDAEVEADDVLLLGEPPNIRMAGPATVESSVIFWDDDITAYTVPVKLVGSVTDFADGSSGANVGMRPFMNATNRGAEELEPVVLKARVILDPGV